MSLSKRGRSRKQEEMEERYQQGITLLLQLSETGTPIVVEGQKDVEALRRLGLQGPIHTLTGHSIISLTEELAKYEKLLILFDFDKRGEQLSKQLSRQLEGRRVSLLREMRRKLKHSFTWRVRVIEGLKPLKQTSKATRF